jgi:hypothetical protein
MAAEFTFPITGTSSGSSNYPNAVDDQSSLPLVVDLITPINAIVINRLRDAIIAVQTELGAQPSREFGTVRARLDDMRALLTTVQQAIAAINAELGANPSGTFNTVQARLNDVDTRIFNLTLEVEALKVALATASEVVTPIVSGIENTDSTTFTAVGAGVLNPTSLGHPAVTFTLEVVLQTTDASFAASFELFNITEGLAVAHPAVTTIATNPTFLTVTVIVGGADLPANQDNVLEGRLKLAAGAAPADRAICKYAAIRSTPA